VVALGTENGRARCSFCSKRRQQVAGLASTGDVEICGACLKLCEEILAERLT